VVFAALLGNLLGAVGGLLLLRKFDREFPFGPALVAGWTVVVAAADNLVS
jgi:prepilin signal peptidase PulO-like enzyme (type II secretory pathway)